VVLHDPYNYLRFTVDFLRIEFMRISGHIGTSSGFLTDFKGLNMTLFDCISLNNPAFWRLCLRIASLKCRKVLKYPA
jgi:hypothetical protein